MSEINREKLLEWLKGQEALYAKAQDQYRRNSHGFRDCYSQCSAYQNVMLRVRLGDFDQEPQLSALKEESERQNQACRYTADLLEQALDENAALKKRAAELEREIRRINTLPYITDEMHDALGDTCLMTWDRATNRPHWTQIAVDFCCILASAFLAKKDPTNAN